MEILVGDAVRPIQMRDGLGYLSMMPKEEYGIRFGNTSNQEAMVDLQIDGLSVFHLCEKRKGLGRKSDPSVFRWFVIPPQQKVLVKGWFINEQKSLAFLITPFQESVAFKTGKTSKIGMITATFHASWKSNDRPPRDEPIFANLLEFNTNVLIDELTALPKAGKIGTGTGSEIDTQVQAQKREAGVPRATISLRYERPKN